MSTSSAVLITGAAGGIGSALVEAYAEAGWRVIATDRNKVAHSSAHAFVQADFEEIAPDDAALEGFVATIREALQGFPLRVLVNNAAIQILGNVPAVSLSDWERTLRLNVTTPFRLAQALLRDLQSAHGTVINVGSVHAQATKREFVAYATSKAALHGLTQAMAVDLGGNPRVLCVAPAAVGTKMLRDGFADKPEALADLAAAHPVGRIAKPAEIARSIVSLSQEPFMFATGTTVWLDGGVLSRLYDPA
ncbi:MAG: SDR family oxidoreductase [Pseudomonadota bacterium]